MSSPAHPSIMPRFEGADGRTRLAAILKRFPLVNGVEEVAATLAEKSELLERPEGYVILQQGAADNDLYLVVSGTVDIAVNGRLVAHRHHGQHVGELALVDHMVRRSATVTAAEPCLLAKVTEVEFAALAERYPYLWRNLAIEIGNRLRERSHLIKQPRSQPVLFVASTSEQLDVARAIQVGLAREPIVCNVWTDGVFEASATSVESLVRIVAECDFAALVVTPDDVVDSRGAENRCPRDNLLLELGMFIGGIGRSRTYILRPLGVDMKMPSDLFGVTPLEYATGPLDTVQGRVAPICTQIMRKIREFGPR